MPEHLPADPDVLASLVRDAFPRAGSVSVTPASGGRLVVVYRAVVDGARYYLRLAEEPGQDMTTDALVLERLRARGVRVPGVVAASPPTAAFPRSWVLMTEIPGDSIARRGTDQEVRQAATAAGRDAAVINSVPVAGFGWVRRDGSAQLAADLPSYRQFAASDLPVPWPGVLRDAFGPRQLDALSELAAAERDRPLRHGYLAHGDLDVSHVYAHAGRYSGIIDFGEMRGADPYFDLGHFLLHDGETRPAELFSSFLRGYLQVTPLPDGYLEAIRGSAILLGLRQLSHWLSPERAFSLSRPLVQLRITELSNLLRGEPACGSGSVLALDHEEGTADHPGEP